MGACFLEYEFYPESSTVAATLDGASINGGGLMAAKRIENKGLREGIECHLGELRDQELAGLTG